MATLLKWSDFLTSVGPFLGKDKPLDSLKLAGFTLSGEVAKGFDQPPPRPAFGPNALAVLESAYGTAPPITLNVGRSPIAPPPPPPPPQPSGFRAALSGKLSILNDVLAEMWRVRTIPRELTADQTGHLVTVSVLDEACTGVPPDSTLGNLAITTPPVAFRSNTTKRNVRVDVPFSLPLQPSGVSLRGILHVEVLLKFEQKFDPPAGPRVHLSRESIDGLTVSLELSPSSDLQLRSEDKRGPLEGRIQRALVFAATDLFFNRDTLSFPGSVVVSNSFPNSRVEITQMAGVTVRAAGAEFVVVGVNVTDEQPNTNAANLDTEQLPQGASNLHARIDQALATDALQAIVRSGDLARFINRAVQRHIPGPNIVGRRRRHHVRGWLPAAGG
jgi:hypothetical protein